MPKLPPYSRRAYPASGKGRYSRRGTVPSSRRYISKGRRGFQRTGGEYRFGGRTGMGGRGVKPELKWFDVLHRQTAADGTIWRGLGNPAVAIANPLGPNAWYTNVSLLRIPQGAGSQERIGRKILIKSINVDLTFATAFTATQIPGNYVNYRMMLVWDKQCNGTAANLTELFNNYDVTPGEGVAAAEGQEPDINHPLNIPNNLRFQILKTWNGTVHKDNQFPANYNLGATVGAQSMTPFRVHGYKRVNIPIEYGDAGMDIALIRSNNIFLVVTWTGFRITGAFTVGNNYFSPCGVVRVRYTDV